MASTVRSERVTMIPTPARKCSVAMAGENLVDRAAGGGLDLGIGIDERQPEALGEPPADARLPGAHQADQDERAGEDERRRRDRVDGGHGRTRARR